LNNKNKFGKDILKISNKSSQRSHSNLENISNEDWEQAKKREQVIRVIDILKIFYGAFCRR